MCCCSCSPSVLQKLRGCRTTGILGSPSPIKKRCRPGSTSSDFSCFSVHTGDTPLNRSSLTTTTSETDEDEFDDDEWPDMDSSTVVAKAPHRPSSTRGHAEGSEGYDIRAQPPPPLLYDEDEPVHRAGPSTLPAVQPQPQGPPRRLWAAAGECERLDGTYLLCSLDSISRWLTCFC